MPALAEVPVRLAGEFRLFEIEMAAELAGLRGIFYRTFSGGQRPRTATLEARVGIEPTNKGFADLICVSCSSVLSDDYRCLYVMGPRKAHVVTRPSTKRAASGQESQAGNPWDRTLPETRHGPALSEHLGRIGPVRNSL